MLIAYLANDYTIWITPLLIQILSYMRILKKMGKNPQKHVDVMAEEAKKLWKTPSRKPSASIFQQKSTEISLWMKFQRNSIFQNPIFAKYSRKTSEKVRWTIILTLKYPKRKSLSVKRNPLWKSPICFVLIQFPPSRLSLKNTLV